MSRGWIALLQVAALAQPPEGEVPLFKTSSNLVVVTVFARDKQGRPVADLKQEDFALTENGKPQTIAAFEFQNLEAPVGAATAASGDSPAIAAPVAGGRQRFRDRRLLVLFYDWSAMAKTDQIRALEAGREFLRTKLTAADLVAIVTYQNRVNVAQEFTADRDQLTAALEKIFPGVENEATVENEDAEVTDEAAFQADLREFNLFNTDRKLVALEEVAQHFGSLPEKKAIIYFAGEQGGRTGAENESQLRSTINAAVRANASFYPIDVRGLEAAAPAGDATVSMPKGTDVFSGLAQTKLKQKKADSRDTLYALAADTGGKALLDDNDLSMGIVQAQRDLRSYYILGYYSADDRRDGKFRRVAVKVNREGVELDYRRGWFAEKDFKSYSADERDRQLEDALLAGDPVTDVPLALEVDWFRLKNGRWFVPVAVKIPGSAIPPGKKSTAKVDFIGQVRDEKGALAQAVRDMIEVRVTDGSRALLYDTGFTLAPGKYKLKMLVRENSGGKMGTFETVFTLPAAGEEAGLVLSPLVLSHQRVPAKGLAGQADKKAAKLWSLHPLVRDGQKLLPSVTRVFRRDQRLTVYAEAYGPEGAPLAATLSFYRDGQFVRQTAPLAVKPGLAGRPAATALLVETPLAALAPGRYTVQLSVIDAAGERFAFGRSPLVVTR